MLEIIYKDTEIVIIRKPYGLDCQYQIPQFLKQQLNCDIYTVHRLDTIVTGVMVFCLNQKSAAILSKEITEKVFKKEYLAIIEGCFKEQQNRLTDLLFHDKRVNKTYVVKKKRKGVKEALLEYKQLCSINNNSLLLIRLLTGRTHQIRVQLASRSHPIIGDGKYGSNDNGKIQLFCYHISFVHPTNQTVMDFKLLPSQSSLFDTFKNHLEEGELCEKY